VFDYQPLPRESIDGVRHCLTPGGTRVPSVTAILSATRDDSGLRAWRRRVGEAEARRISTEASSVGTAMHKRLERHILGETVPPPEGPLQETAHRMADVIIDHALPRLDTLWGVETPLYYPDLYAGTSDCIGVFDGEPAILDFKQSNRPKRREWIGDYLLQLTAYALAHNKVHDTHIRRGVVLVCTRDLVFQEFTLEPEDFAASERAWFRRVEAFRAAHAAPR